MDNREKVERTWLPLQLCVSEA